jgi:hypothetical protein
MTDKRLSSRLSGGSAEQILGGISHTFVGK